MRQVIGGKLFDTDTAELLHEWTNRKTYSDFQYRSKTLYRTSKGTLFIHHEGGAMTDQATPAPGGGRGFGESIEPVSEEDAIAFLESRGTTEASDAILEHFSEHVEEA